jgi:hypothetical protein
LSATGNEGAVILGNFTQGDAPDFDCTEEIVYVLGPEKV